MMPTTLPQLKRRNPPWTPLQRLAWLAERRRRTRQGNDAPPVTLLTNLVAYWKLEEAAG